MMVVGIKSAGSGANADNTFSQMKGDETLCDLGEITWYCGFIWLIVHSHYFTKMKFPKLEIIHLFRCTVFFASGVFSPAHQADSKLLLVKPRPLAPCAPPLSALQPQ